MAEDVTKLRGVNLGGWLVIEKWMTPSLFAGISAADEYGLCEELGRDAAGILTFHRDHFITEADFKWIAARGLNAVRLPIGHWIFGRSKPYVGGIEYVDQALDWAEQYGLSVILDIHGAPGSQNGKDHSGRIGSIDWHKEDNVYQTLKLLERLCKRYKGVPALVGIELLNEPSWRLGRKRLTGYYEQAYDIVRGQLGDDVFVVFPDAFKPKRWKRTLTGRGNVMLDVHLYQLFSRRDRRRSLASHMKLAMKRAKLIHKLRKVRPVMIGEWSIALPKDRGGDPTFRAYGALQLLSYTQADAWFYWSYKTEQGGPWSFRDCVRRGWLPEKFSQ